MPDRIRIRRAGGTVVIRAGGAVIGETKDALELTEGSRPPVLYVPRQDVAMALLERSDLTTGCPLKGVANYYSIVTKSGVLKDAVWTYETPLPAAAGIAGHLAFYPDRVTVERL